MNSKSISLFSQKLYHIILLGIVLDSLFAWFFWSIANPLILPLLFAVLTGLVAILNPKLFSFNRKSVLATVFFYVLARFAIVSGNFNAYLGAILLSVNILIFFSLTVKSQLRGLNFLNKALGVIIGVSLLAWFLFLLGAQLPYFPDSFGFSELRMEAQYFFNNYYFFLHNIGTSFTDLLTLILPRFSSIILEPGYLGILLVILLYINGFNLRKKFNIVFLIALFFTFSLAGWLLCIFAYTFIALRTHKQKIKVIISILLGVFAFNAFFSNYLDGNNVVNEFVLQRLKFDDDRGTIAGYNRTSEDFDRWFNTSFITSSEVLLGSDTYRTHFLHTTNVGWKPYMAQFGLLGLGLYVLFLFYVFYVNKNFLTFGFFILYILIFSRGHHEIFWAAYVILYVAGCNVLGAENKHNISQSNKIKTNAIAH